MFNDQELRIEAFEYLSELREAGINNLTETIAHLKCAFMLSTLEAQVIYSQYIELEEDD